MFGLSDNSDKNNQPAAPADNNAVAVATPPMDNNSPLNNTAPEPPVVAPAQSVPPVAAAPAPAYNGGDNSANASPVMPGPSLSDVSLNNAYIPTDSVNASGAPAGQPTTASLLDDAGEDELIKLKQQALQSLAPLMEHLEQTPEEKFKTTMMLIQASDNAELIQEAFDAANKIADEKVRAQALLDVVNEINYFTHHNVPPTVQSV